MCGLNNLFRLGRRVHMRNHDPMRTPIEHTGDEVWMRRSDAHDALRFAATQRPQLIRHGGFRSTAVLQIDQHPVEA